MTDSVQSDEGARAHRSSSSTHGHDHSVLNVHRAFSAAIPDSSVGSVRKVARLDGRTRIIAGRVPGGTWWKLRHRLRFTREHARQLRAAGVSEVILRRGLKGASFPLAWLSNRPDPSGE